MLIELLILDLLSPVMSGSVYTFSSTNEKAKFMWGDMPAIAATRGIMSIAC